MPDFRLIAALLCLCVLSTALMAAEAPEQQAKDTPAEVQQQPETDQFTEAAEARTDLPGYSAVNNADTAARASLQTAAQPLTAADAPAGICPVIDSVVTDYCQQQPDDPYCQSLR